MQGIFLKLKIWQNF